MIRVAGVNKQFRLYSKPSDRLRELILRRPYHTVHQALQGISFELPSGQTLGVLGQNGAGKSTLLKLLTGVLLPDSGSIEINGRLTGLLELGTGFNLETSGHANIQSNAALLGMTPDEIEARRTAIVDFAELGPFISEPLKTYSSGMLMRLGFGIAIHADPACFVVDEALSVGDAYFQQKCMRAIHDFRARGGSVLFVSHDMSAIKSLCDEAILLEGGRIVDRGMPRDVVDHYHGMLLRKSHRGDLPVSVTRPDSQAEAVPLAGTGEVDLVAVDLLDAEQHPVASITSEERLVIRVRLRAHRDLDQPHYGIGIRNRFGHSVFETNTSCAGVAPEPLLAGEGVAVEWELVANLSAGDYAITVGVANRAQTVGSFEETLLFTHDAAMLEVTVNPDAILYDGAFNMHPAIRILQPEVDA